MKRAAAKTFRPNAYGATPQNGGYAELVEFLTAIGPDAVIGFAPGHGNDVVALYWTDGQQSAQLGGAASASHDDGTNPASQSLWDRAYGNGG